MSRGKAGIALTGIAVVAFLGLGGLSLLIGGGGADRPPDSDTASVQAIPIEQQSDADGRTAQFSMCGSSRYTCVVDGDTIWLEGQNLRLQSYDTPEPYDGVCGGDAEVALAKRASARLLELLNGNAFTVETFGMDGTGKRTLATIKIAGRDVGDILIDEGLARRWPDGHEFWC